MPDLARKLSDKISKNLPPPQFLGVFFEKNKRKKQNCLEFSDLARKLIKKTFTNFYPPPRQVCQNISTGVDGGAEQRADKILKNGFKLLKLKI